MQSYEIETLPCVKFAHIFHADTYDNVFTTRAHAMEITFISEGAITVGYGGEEHVAAQGDIVCLPYDLSRISVKSDTYHEHHTVYAQLTWSLQAHADGLYLPLITPAKYNTRAAANIIDRLIRDPLLYKNSPTKGAALFLDLLCEIDQCNKKAQKLKLPGEVLYTQRAKEYVQEHLHLPITQKSVAEHLSISPAYLCAVFKKVEGIPFQKYVNYQKLEGIKHLLEKEPVHMYQAAALFGYSDPNYVSRLFKQHYGYNITDIKSAFHD
ncbi:MAG: helix-turn-helix transcriptional regulator [Clostridia bacterium]|nr:helix-turn-helix transcriptional regulator [Clostridia bacterium]